MKLFPRVGIGNNQKSDLGNPVFGKKKVFTSSQNGFNKKKNRKAFTKANKKKMNKTRLL